MISVFHYIVLPVIGVKVGDALVGVLARQVVPLLNYVIFEYVDNLFLYLNMINPISTATLNSAWVSKIVIVKVNINTCKKL